LDIYAFKRFRGTPYSRKKVLKKKNKKDVFSQAKQVSLKNIVNTLYGVITSRHFNVNNVVLAEMITGGVRANVWVWLLAKPMNTFLSIKDGGPFSRMKVFSLKKSLKTLKLPRLESLSYYKYLQKHRFIKVQPLKDLPWDSYFENNLSPNLFPDVAALATEHIRGF